MDPRILSHISQRQKDIKRDKKFRAIFYELFNKWPTKQQLHVLKMRYDVPEQYRMRERKGTI